MGLKDDFDSKITTSQLYLENTKKSRQKGGKLKSKCSSRIDDLELTYLSAILRSITLQKEKTTALVFELPVNTGYLSIVYWLEKKDVFPLANIRWKT